MTSFVPSSPDHASSRASNRSRRATVQRRGAALALASLLAVAAPGPGGAEDDPPAEAGTEQLVAAEPALEGALAECQTDAADDEAVSQCLDTMETRVAGALDAVLATATGYFAGLDAITGNRRASLTLGQGQAAFELYRDLDCHLVELGQGVSTSANDHGRACRIDHDRARLAKLAALVPPAADDATAPGEPDDVRMILDTAWRAVEIDGTPVADDLEVTFAIGDAAAVSGVGGCNRYFGTAEIAGERIAMGALGATRMACPDPAMDEERRFFQALEAAATWRIEEGTLLLADDGGTVRVRLEHEAG